MSGPPIALHGQEPSQIEVWTPLPAKPNPFVPPHKAWTKLSEVLAKHKGQQNWSELIVDDNLFHGEYISMAPGAKTPRRFHQDNRAFWIVQDGQIRFTIEGQEPFVATKGFLVQVPKRLVYSMETVGDTPSLRFEVLMANAQTMYPADETPPPTPGIRFEKTRVASSKGSYDEANVPYIDYNLTIAGKQKTEEEPNAVCRRCPRWWLRKRRHRKYSSRRSQDSEARGARRQGPPARHRSGVLVHPRREDGMYDWLSADLRRRSRRHRLRTCDCVAPAAIRRH